MCCFPTYMKLCMKPEDMTWVLQRQAGLKTCFCTDFLHSNHHCLNEKYFLFCDWAWKHPVHIISQTKYTTNVFIQWSGLKTWFHTDCCHKIIKCLNETYFLFCGRAWKCFVVYIISHKCPTNIMKHNLFCGPAWKCFVMCIISHKCSTNIFRLAVRLKNISWRLLVTIIYTSCTSIIHLSENMFCFMGWPEISLQFLVSGKPVWWSGLKVWFQVNKNLLFFRCNLHHNKNWNKNDVVNQKDQSTGVFPLKNWKLMPVLCGLVTQCLGSLTFSIVSATSANDAPTIQGKRIMDCTQSHA